MLKNAVYILRYYVNFRHVAYPYSIFMSADDDDGRLFEYRSINSCSSSLPLNSKERVCPDKRPLDKRASLSYTLFLCKR